QGEAAPHTLAPSRRGRSTAIAAPARIKQLKPPQRTTHGGVAALVTRHFLWRFFFFFFGAVSLTSTGTQDTAITSARAAIDRCWTADRQPLLSRTDSPEHWLVARPEEALA